MKPNRRTFIYALVLIVLVIAIVAGAVLLQDSDDSEAQDSNNDSGPQPPDPPSMVTVIVVDDFSASLEQLALNLEVPDEALAQRAEEIRKLVEPYRAEGELPEQLPDELIDEIATILLQFNEEFGGIAADDFQAYLSDRKITLPSEDSKCTINPEGTGIFVTGGTGIFVAGGTGIFVAGGTAQPEEVAHGTLVMSLLEELHTTYGGELNTRGEPVNIEFRRVNIADFDLSTLVQQLSDEIKATRADYPDGKIVVNMSFGIIPCRAIPSLALYTRLMLEFLKEEYEFDLDTLRAVYKTWLAIDAPQRMNQPGMSYASLFCERDQIEDNPLCADDMLEPTLEVVDADRSLILVGAAGNGPTDKSGGQEFPYYPAAWPQVIPISGSFDNVDFITRQPIAAWSNFGTVLMPGLWYWSNPFNIPSEQYGTSFAAPRYSYLIALHLAQSNADVENCGGPGQIPGPAPLYNWLNQPPSPPNVPPC